MMRRIGKIQLGPDSRREIAETSLTLGIHKTAEFFNVNAKTVSLWRRRLLKGEEMFGKNDTAMSTQEKERILNLAKRGGVETIKSFQKRHEIDRSTATIYNLFVSSGLSREAVKRVDYSCSGCFETFRAVAIYWGIPRKTECPECGGLLSREGSYRLTFLGPGTNLYVIDDKRLIPICKKEIRSVRETHLLRASAFPKFVDVMEEENHKLIHILKSLSGDSYLFFCGLSSPSESHNPPYSSLSNRLIDSDALCYKCVDVANLLLSEGKTLKPVLRAGRGSKKERMIEIVYVGLLSGNIKRTCELYSRSRTTFYNYLKKVKRLEPDVIEIFTQVKKEALSKRRANKSDNLNTLKTRRIKS